MINSILVLWSGVLLGKNKIIYKILKPIHFFMYLSSNRQEERRIKEWMDENRVIKQDSPSNVLWRWFRIEVEKQELDENVLQELKQVITRVTQEKN